jgi:hypothetical protein
MAALSGFNLVAALENRVKNAFLFPGLCPGLSRPLAARQAILALVPVPHGERS